MMRLLERLAQQPGKKQDGEEVVNSVANHLQQLFNVRHGSCVVRKDMGLPVISPLSLRGEEQQQHQLCRIIQQQIKLFEPRLIQAKVSVQKEDPDFLLFQLRGGIPVGHESLEVHYLIKVDSDSIAEVLVQHFQYQDSLPIHSKQLQRALNVTR